MYVELIRAVYGSIDIDTNGSVNNGVFRFSLDITVDMNNFLTSLGISTQPKPHS